MRSVQEDFLLTQIYLMFSLFLNERKYLTQKLVSPYSLFPSFAEAKETQDKQTSQLTQNPSYFSVLSVHTTY